MNDYFVETSIKRIKEANQNNKLVIFVGAGVSANSGIPTWGELIKEMAKDLGEFDVEHSPDLYLKIPQYFYNERGEKEYFEKLNDVFVSKKYKPNPIHEEIYKLAPTHIITTNYDTLLEEAAIQYGYFYHTVRSDLDLPYDNLNKTIIKMHGDFINRNIVLKEDDYLNYSSNFTLIESYLKSLIATNTVLFIGYSINDPNFNLIFQWVKSILKNHFQPAYLIESSKSYSRMEHSYYKNRGINIIYYDEIKDLPRNMIFKNSNWRGNQLYDVLKYFNDFDKSKSLGELDYLYDKLNCFEKLNFIMPDQIVKNLKLKSVGYDLNGNRTLTSKEDNNALVKVFSNSEEYQKNDLFKKICAIFNKANIKGVSSKDKKIIFSINDNDYLSNMLNEIIASDSLFATNNIGNPNSLLINQDYFSMLKQAYTYYESDNFIEAYNYYKSISLKSFRDKEYLIYYLSEFNRKHTGHMAIHSFQASEKIKIEVEELDLEDIYSKLPYREKKSLEFIKEIQNFNLIYKVQNKLRKEVDVLKTTKRNIDNGGFSINSSLDKNFTIMTNIWLFIKSNYLCLDKYLEVQSLYKSFVEGLVASYCTKSEINPKSLFGDIKVNKIDELNTFVVYIMITKLKTEDIESIFNEYNLKQINIELEAMDYITKTLDSVLNNILENKATSKIKTYFNNLLIILSKVNLDSIQLNLIANKLLPIINEKMRVQEFKYINRFIVSIANRDLISQETVVKYITKYLKLYQQNKSVCKFDNAGLYSNLTTVYKPGSEYLIDTSITSIYLEFINRKIQENEKDLLYELLGEIILPIIKGIVDNQKTKILDIVKDLLKIIEHKDTINHNEMLFYYKVVILKLNPPNKKINTKILEDTVSKIKDQKSGIRVYPDPVERNLNILADLYRKGGIEKKEIEIYSERFKGFSEYFDLIFGNKNLNITDIELFSYLTDVEIEEIMDLGEVKLQVYEQFDKILFENQSRVTMEIFDKLYMKKFS